MLNYVKLCFQSHLFIRHFIICLIISFLAALFESPNNTNSPVFILLCVWNNILTYLISNSLERRALMSRNRFKEHNGTSRRNVKTNDMPPCLRTYIPEMLKKMKKRKLMEVIDHLVATSAITLGMYRKFTCDYQECRDLKNLCRLLLIAVMEEQIDLELFCRALEKAGQKTAAQYVRNQIQQDDLKLSIEEVGMNEV